jgi:hypothetical protein
MLFYDFIIIFKEVWATNNRYLGIKEAPIAADITYSMHTILYF